MSDPEHAALPAHVPAIDGVRAVAALAVVVTHCFLSSVAAITTQGRLNPFLAGGSVGVDMFFVVSGFVLFLPYVLGKQLPVRHYFTRRAARLFPAYWVTLVMALALWPLLWKIKPAIGYPLTDLHGIISVVSHLTLTQSIVLGMDVRWIGFGVNAVVWTLTLEACFYVTLPFVARRFLRHPIVWTLAAIAAAVVWRVEFFLWRTDFGLSDHNQARLAYYGDAYPGFLGHFALGMLTAWLLARHRESLARIAPALLVGGVVLALYFEWLGGRDLVDHGLAFHTSGAPYLYGRLAFAAAFTVALVGLVLLPRFATPVFGRGPLKWLGDRSYGIYLFHFFAIGVLVEARLVFDSFERSGFLWGVAIVAPIAIAMGALSFALFERPAIAWAKRRTTPVMEPAGSAS